MKVFKIFFKCKLFDGIIMIFWEFILIIVKNKIENCVCIYDNVIFLFILSCLCLKIFLYLLYVYIVVVVNSLWVNMGNGSGDKFN